MLSINKKKYLLICCYTIFLTIITLLCFFFFINRAAADIESMPKIFYYNNSNSATISYASITSQQLQNYFRASFFEYFPLLIATICFFIILFSAILFYNIKLLDKKYNKQIANDLTQAVSDDVKAMNEPLLKKEYYLINQKILAFEEDQRRLHSYITHEQKNLIMLIKGRINKEDTAILKDVEKLSQSVDDVLTLSTHKDSEKTVCDLAMIAAEECDKYKSIYPELYFDFEEEGSYTILGKEQWLRRAIDNIIENAIKYGNQNPIHVFLKQKYNSVLLYIKDNGKGISPKDQEAIFDYGYQIHTLKKDGYGIGLSLVCHVCNLCNGFINVKSELGKGSLFTLSFPLKS